MAFTIAGHVTGMRLCSFASYSKSKVDKNRDFLEKKNRIFKNLNQIFLFKSDHDLY